MHKRSRFAPILILLFSLTGCKTSQQQSDSVHELAARSGAISVKLLGVNDLHGQLNVTRTVNGKPAGRADYLAAYLKKRQATNINTLLVHAGDMVGASAPVSALLRDEPTIEIMNQMGFRIGTDGNHEFDQGVPEMLRLIRGGSTPESGSFGGALFPYIVANVLTDQTTGKNLLTPYKVMNVQGIPIGFIGICLTNTPNTVLPSAVKGLTFIDEVKAINAAAAELKQQGVRAIVVLAHNPGTSQTDGSHPTGQLVDIANRTDDEVDVIFGGHSHTYMNTVVNHKLIVQAYSYGIAFSDVDLQIDPTTKDIVQKKAEIVTTYQAGITPDPQIKSMISQYEAKTSELVNRVVGKAALAVTSTQNANGESALGDLIADAQRASMNTSFAFMNPGGIRANLEQGTVTWGDLYTVQPFRNKLVKLDLTGKQIRALLNQQWSAKGTSILQVSGLSYTWDKSRAVGDRIVDIYLKDGTKLAPSRSYSVTANSFLAEGGDNFTIFLQGQHRVMGKTDIDAMADYIRKQPNPFTYRVQGRIRQLHK